MIDLTLLQNGYLYIILFKPLKMRRYDNEKRPVERQRLKPLCFKPFSATLKWECFCAYISEVFMAKKSKYEFTALVSPIYELIVLFYMFSQFNARIQ